ncbi:MAG: DNA polymerase IV [Eubacteriales bacterium]|nr:DNA polymerase IV [Eubacteriales bacterium]
MDRLIYHVDVNSAYLSWEAAEQLKNGAETDIREIPAIIGGDTSRRKGVVLAKSLPAKACGVRTGEPVTDALKKCPDLKSFPPNFPLYKKYSRAFIGILRQYAPVVEQVSIDEAYLDMSGLHFFYKNAEEAAQAIRKEIREQLGFTVNIGISSNKLLAKMASDFEKPDKIHTLFLEEIRDKMWPLPVRELFLTGASAAAKLKELGIETIGDLAGSDPVFLKAHLKTQGETLWRYANGMEDSPVKGEKEEAKGYGNSTTLGKDVTEYEEAARIFLYLCDTVARRLRRDGLFARTVEVEVKDCHFKRHSHQRVLDYSTNTSGELHQICCRLFKELWDGTPLRLLGVRCTKLTEENLRPQMEQAVAPNLHIYENKASGQMMMDFGERDAALAEQKNRKRLEQERKHQKLARMDEALDKIKEKYGEDSIGRAGRLRV